MLLSMHHAFPLSGFRYGYGRLQTYNSTHMHYVFSALSRNASVADEFWIVKSPKNVA